MNIKSAQNSQENVIHSFIEFPIFHAILQQRFSIKSVCPAHTEWKEQHSGQNLFYLFSNLVYLGSFNSTWTWLLYQVLLTEEYVLEKWRLDMIEAQFSFYLKY